MKHVKAAIYGLPGAGKSVFVNDAPNRFFITTDGNYEYLEEFGAKEEDHVQVHSWKEMKQVISDIVTGKKYQGYDTYIVDILENAFKWCEYEYCKKNGFEHISEPGYAKGYDITRTEFLIEISRLLDMNVNVFLLLHGNDYNMADKRGITKLYHGVSNRIPDKVITEIEGKVRMFLRCYTEDVEEDGKFVTKRYLSLVPKANEYGIIRGFDASSIPTDIPLDFETFANVIHLEMPKRTSKSTVEKPAEKPVEAPIIKDIKLEPVKESSKPKEEPKQEPVQEEHISGEGLTKEEKPTMVQAEEKPKQVVVEKTQKTTESLSDKKAKMDALLARLTANKKG